MQLNELLEEHSLRSISDRTMISEDNIECIVAEDFASLSKAKALGFLSILEREYNLDIKNVKKSIEAYYATHSESKMHSNFTSPRVEESKGRSKLFFILMLALLAYASWYFFTQFDKKTLNTLMPFNSDKPAVLTEDMIENNSDIDAPKIAVEKEDIPNTVVVAMEDISKKEESKRESIETNVVISNDITVDSLKAGEVVLADISHTNKDALDVKQSEIQSVNATTLMMPSAIVENNVEEINGSDATTIEKQPKKIEVNKITITPDKRLWFGLVNISTGKRDHFTRRKAFPIDVSNGGWLVATSSAPFSLTYKDEVEKFNNGKEHYFKVSKTGIVSLSKKEYVRKGGYKKW